MRFKTPTTELKLHEMKTEFKKKKNTDKYLKLI